MCTSMCACVYLLVCLRKGAHTCTCVSAYACYRRLRKNAYNYIWVYVCSIKCKPVCVRKYLIIYKSFDSVSLSFNANNNHYASFFII